MEIARWCVLGCFQLHLRRHIESVSVVVLVEVQLDLKPTSTTSQLIMDPSVLWGWFWIVTLNIIRFNYVNQFESRGGNFHS